MTFQQSTDTDEAVRGLCRGGWTGNREGASDQSTLIGVLVIDR
jgi:hypothetical protein